jgi:hypothetical protein
MNSFGRRIARLQGKLLVSSSTARVRLAADKRGEVLGEAVLIERVRFLGALTAEVAQQAINRAWKEKEVRRFWDGEWPSFASVAWEQCFGKLTSPRKDVHVDSRALRIAQARAGEVLRSVEHSHAIITELLGGREAPDGSDAVSVRNAHRAIKNEIKRRKHAGVSKFIPTQFFEVRPQPPELSADVVRLDPTDSQFAYWQADGERAILHVKLPTKARPRSKKHWAWHQLRVDRPQSVRRALGRGGVLAKPTLRIKNGRLLIQLATEELAPEAKTTGRFLCLDWGERRLLTASIIWTAPDGALRTTGRPLFFESKAIQGKLYRLRANANALQKKLDHIEKLLAGRPRPDPELQVRGDAKQAECDHVWARYSNLSAQLAHAAACWAKEMARVHDCEGALTENLKSLEARFSAYGKSKNDEQDASEAAAERVKRGNARRALNARINHQVRSKVYKHLKHKCQPHGISFAAGYARGTSSYCPRCRAPITHQKASDNPARGRGWMLCSHCGFSADRDHASAECIGSRCLNPNAWTDAEQAMAARKAGEKPTAPSDKPIRRSHRGRSVRLARPRPGRRLAELATASPVSLSSSCRRAGRVGTGRCVRPGVAPREGSNPAQRPGLLEPTAVSIMGSPVRHSRYPARALQGMYQGFTGQLAFTASNLPNRQTRRGSADVKASDPAPA